MTNCVYLQYRVHLLNMRKNLKNWEQNVLNSGKKRIWKQHCDGLVLPGGESTVQGKLLRELGCSMT